MGEVCSRSALALIPPPCLPGGEPPDPRQGASPLDPGGVALGGDPRAGWCVASVTLGFGGVQLWLA
ncbi:hypothetical protein GCM10017567_33820 [Amycolatopsis bullii]|uniref:Uncharacterized protein n=1 Tax=Amycolatopsis bullii TaxID=941987 RepID=A0ABQ3KGX0_9PSEU|nr:hypothetical protein GCM10017567_33820 [Amycolatopsis bullii]